LLLLTPEPADAARAKVSGLPEPGVNVRLGGIALFPASSPWRQPIDKANRDPHSEEIITFLGSSSPLLVDFGPSSGTPFAVVTNQTPLSSVLFDEPDRSDPGPYPIPGDALVEMAPDLAAGKPLLMLNRDRWLLHELYGFRSTPEGFRARAGAVFDLFATGFRPADAPLFGTGLPVLPGLLRLEETLAQRNLGHALAFTLAQARRAWIPPARDTVGTGEDPRLPPIGARFRLRRTFDVYPFPPRLQVLLMTLKTHGMILVGEGAHFCLTGTPDRRWSDRELALLRDVKARDFEVIRLRGD